MRKIADESKIKGLRREFYDLLMHACSRYMIDCWIERDVRGINEAKALYLRGLSVAREMQDVLRKINSHSPAQSWYREISYKRQCEFDTFALEDDMQEFYNALDTVFGKMPQTAVGRRKKIALRKLTDKLMDFWEFKLKRNISIPNDRQDGMSECHRFLHDVLKVVDPEAVRHLPTLVRERRTCRLQRT